MNIAVVRPPCPIHSETISRALNATLVDDPDEACGYDWLVFLYVGPAQAGAVETAQRRGIKTMGYWIGSDSLRAQQQTHLQKMMPRFQLECCVHERLRKELTSWGRDAHVVFPPVRRVPSPQPAPGPCVGVYIPTIKPLYGFTRCVAIAEQCPELPFIFYGSELPRLPNNCANKHHLTPSDASELLKQFSVVLRMTTHDGFPQNILEQKMGARSVVCSYPYPGCHYAFTDDQAVQWLKREHLHDDDLSDWPNWYRENMSPIHFRKTIFKLMEESCP